MTQTTRVLYSIKQEILSRFNAAFKGRERSRVIERLMERAIEEREAEVVAAVRLVETDPAFAAARAVSDDVDALSVRRPPLICHEPQEGRHPLDQPSEPRSQGR